MKTLNILGVIISDISRKNLIAIAQESLKNKEKCVIYTVNNEFIVEAQTNSTFKSVLNDSTISIADSAGVVWAAKELYKEKIERIPGADFFIDLVNLSKNGYGMFLLGGQKGVAEKAKEELEKSIKGCKIVGTLDGIEINDQENPEIISRINESGAQIVCVALGAPKQETWIQNNYKKINASVFIGIGGTLDYASGKIRRAPKFMRKLGMEWLFRLMAQPSRYPRIKKALVEFPKLVRRQKTLD